jgi:cytochrome c556
MTSRRSLGWTFALLGGLATFGACASQTHNQPPQKAQLARAVSPPPRTGSSEYLSPTAREILKKSMASHARRMNGLVASIMVLKYPEIAEGAEEIAADASLSRPITGDATELNAVLPQGFFVQQDRLREQARALADAARALDPYSVADAYGRLSEACVRCHAVYRQGP